MDGIKLLRFIYHLIGHGVNLIPILTILPIFHECEVNMSKFPAYFPEVIIISAVTAQKYICGIFLNNKRSPECLGIVENFSSGEMSRWSTIENKTIGKCFFIPPIHFCDKLCIIAPIFEIFTYAKRAYDMSDLVLQFLYSLIVKVVIMVVGNDKKIYLRHILWMVDFRSFVGFACKGEWSCSVKYRINQNSLT